MIPLAGADPMQTLIETLGSEYEALMPPPQWFRRHGLPRPSGSLGIPLHGTVNWLALLPESGDARQAGSAAWPL